MVLSSNTDLPTTFDATRVSARPPAVLGPRAEPRTLPEPDSYHKHMVQPRSLALISRGCPWSCSSRSCWFAGRWCPDPGVGEARQASLSTCLKLPSSRHRPRPGSFPTADLRGARIPAFARRGVRLHATPPGTDRLPCPRRSTAARVPVDLVRSRNRFPGFPRRCGV
jgi:hypothetical protein